MPPIPTVRIPKIRRVKTGCIQCRRRRVKCNESHPICGGCAHMGLGCEWGSTVSVTLSASASAIDTQQEALAGSSGYPASSSSSRSPQPQPQQRKRLTPNPTPTSTSISTSKPRNRSCQQCRLSKHHCTQSRPSCERCDQRGIGCVYGNGSQVIVRGASGYEGIGSGGSGVERGGTEEVVEGVISNGSKIQDILSDSHTLHLHIEAFYKHIYPINCFSFLHRKTFYDRLSANTLPRHLLLALCSASTRFIGIGSSTNQQSAIHCQSQQWSQESKSLVLSQISNFSLDSIHTLLLLFYTYAITSQFSSIWLLLPIIIRLSIGLKLHDEPLWINDSASELQKEIRRRTVWSCWSFDRLCCWVPPAYTLLPDESVRVRLPGGEEWYEGGCAGVPMEVGVLFDAGGRVRDGTNGGVKDTITCSFLRLLALRTDILRYIRSPLTHAHPWNPLSPFAKYQQDLFIWKTTLPAHLQLTTPNIIHYQSTNQLTAFLLLHCWYYNNIMELTQLALPGIPETAPPEILSLAPVEWLKTTRESCYQACSDLALPLQQILSIYPDFICENGDLALLMYETVPRQLQYLFLINPVTEEILLGFWLRVEGYVTAFRGMKKWFPFLNDALKDLCAMLDRHGFSHDPDTKSIQPSANELLIKFVIIRQSFRPNTTPSGLPEGDDIGQASVRGLNKIRGEDAVPVPTSNIPLYPSSKITAPATTIPPSVPMSPAWQPQPTNDNGHSVGLFEGISGFTSSWTAEGFDMDDYISW